MFYDERYSRCGFSKLLFFAKFNHVEKKCLTRALVTDSPQVKLRVPITSAASVVIVVMNTSKRIVDTPLSAADVFGNLTKY